MKLLCILVAVSLLLGSTAFHHKISAGKKNTHATPLSNKRHGGIVIATVVNNTSVSMSGSLVLFNTSTNQIYARADFNIPEGASFNGFPPSPYFGDNIKLRINWNLTHGPVLPMGFMGDISFQPGQAQCESINYSGVRLYSTSIDGGTFTFNFYEQPVCQ